MFLVSGKKLADPIFVGTPYSEEVKICFENVEAQALFDTRYEHKAQVDASNEGYDAMDFSEKEVLKKRVRRVIAVLHDQIDIWLPDALSFSNTGDAIRVEFNLVSAELDEDLRLLQEADSFELEEAIKGAEELSTELTETQPLVSVLLPKDVVEELTVSESEVLAGAARSALDR